MYKKGDIIRVIPPDMVALSKSFFLYDQTWDESTGEKDDWVMLGGEYRVLYSNEYLVQLLNCCLNNGVQDHKNIRFSNAVLDCPFKKGDMVQWRQDANETNYYFAATMQSNRFVRSKIFEVVDILNHYFVFLEIGRCGKGTMPWYWEDFELVG